MLKADHLNTDGLPFPVKCVRKCRSALGGEVTSICECVGRACVRMHEYEHENQCMLKCELDLGHDLVYVSFYGKTYKLED